MAKVLDINQNVLQIYHNKDIKFLSEDFVDLALKTGLCIEQSERHHLVFEVLVSGTKGRFPLVTVLNSHPMIDASPFQLCKLLSLS